MQTLLSCNARVKSLANKRDVPYQTLLKFFVHERVQLNAARDLPRFPGAGPKLAR
jgi:hypothetical protein